MGLFFDDPKPRITKNEFRKIRSLLSTMGFSSKELDRVEEVFRGDLFEVREKDKGIDEEELNAGIDWMRKHTNELHLSERKIDILEQKLTEKLH